MPLYEYECKTCPECGGEVYRLIHPAGIIFKGKGFYVTDNRRARSSTVVPKAGKESKPPKTSETQEDPR